MQIFRIFSAFLFLFFSLSPLYGQSRITPSDVYSQATQIVKEIDIIKAHFKIKKKKTFAPYLAKVTPRHSWHKSYVILVKINVLRQQQGLPRYSVGSMEPTKSVQPFLMFEQSQRILTELRIIKTSLGIKAKVSRPNHFVGKRPIDVFNILHDISLQLELINHEAINPTYVFAEVLRIFDDITFITAHFGVNDDTFPPEKKRDVIPKDSLTAAFLLMDEIQRMQKQYGIERTDFSVFRKAKNVVPSDVFNMVGMCVAEIQILKAELEIPRLTPAAEYQEIKTPADVHQLLRWASFKLQKIQFQR